MTTAPDIVVIVLDCARAGTIRGPSDPPEYPGALGRFFRESVSFPRSASSSSWTVPSHATLFTGLPPWEHGCHNQGDAALSSGPPTLAGSLAEAGYSTRSVSENSFLSPATGLTRGFHSQAWGTTARWVSRTDTAPDPPNRLEGPSRAPPGRRGLPRGFADRMLLLGLHRWPMGAAVIERIASGSTDPRSLTAPAGQWVGEAVRGQIRTAPDGSPLFLFVNLLDPHEPYLHSGVEAPGLAEEMRFLSIPQDFNRYLVRKSPLDPGPLRQLARAYHAAVDRSVLRAGEILRSLEERGRWDDSLIVLTSDHGQAFGEHGAMFHGLHVFEEDLRIPMFVKFPGAAHAGSVSPAWAGLGDLWPTVAEWAGISPPEGLDGESWTRLVDHPRKGPLLAIGDGLRGGRAARFFMGGARFDAVNHTYGVAYEGDQKVVLDGTTGLATSFRVGEGLGETPIIDRSPSVELVSLARAAVAALSNPRRPPATRPRASPAGPWPTVEPSRTPGSRSS